MRQASVSTTRRSSRIKRLVSKEVRPARDEDDRPSDAGNFMKNLSDLRLEGDDERDRLAESSTGKLVAECFEAQRT